MVALDYLRMIQGFLNKELVVGDIDDLASLRLTAFAYASLNIDECEWPERLQADEDAGDLSHAMIVDDDVSADETVVFLRDGTKGSKVLRLLRRKSGATLQQIEEATGWQSHSVRGFLSGAVRKKLGLELSSSKAKDAQRIYRVVEGVSGWPHLPNCRPRT